MKTHVSIAAALVLIASAPIALAQQQRLSFEALDSDKDGSLSVAEVGTIAARIASKPTPEELLGRWDTDKDGKVSKAEFDARPRNTQAPAP